MSEKYPSQLAERFQIRLPDGMRDQIRRHAEANNRSMNSEIISLLEVALWQADYHRMDAGLEPLGSMSEEERDRISLGIESDKRRKEARDKALQVYGVDELLEDIAARMERIEQKIDGKR